MIHTFIGRSLAVILQDEMGMNAKRRKQDLVSQRDDAAGDGECCIACERSKNCQIF